LQHLDDQTVEPFETVVVDASPGSESEGVVAEFPGVCYVRNDEGEGTLPRSRLIGIDATTGDIVAFLDDDALADPDWLDELARTYVAGVGGVGGQARNGQIGEQSEGVDRIGRFFSDGSVTGFFAADPGTTVEVDHLIGCNMSFRRSALESCGGVPVWPAGVSALREDLFLSLRVRDSGWTLVFNPRASVEHLGAPQVRGRRFDARYHYNGTRNHLFVLVAHFGAMSPVVWKYVRVCLRSNARSFASAMLHLGMTPIAVATGISRGIRYRSSA
jgi:GT2 family glycosyltransferase